MAIDRVHGENGMGPIPEAEIERLKSKVSIVRLVEAAGIVLARQGKDLAGRCPETPPGSPESCTESAR